MERLQSEDRTFFAKDTEENKMLLEVYTDRIIDTSHYISNHCDCFLY